jgi:nicotinamide-nucleotide amidase
MRIEILCTGDEVLTGKITNTNFSYMAQKLEDVGLDVYWGTTVGDDREALLSAFRLAAGRADAVIVNGGLGPTVDDLSQEIAAQAAGVGLVLHEEWLARMEGFFTSRGRTMPPNNRKQAMLPEGAEFLDNPIGTACGFAMDIGEARFFFTPGVPRELHRMLEEQIIPRLLARSGVPSAIRLKRFHCYGLGESHIDSLLAGVEALAPEGSVKLGFRAHYPQIEIKLTTRGTGEADIAARLAPVQAEVRRRIGNFIIAEDSASLESEVLGALAARGGTLALAETFTGGLIASRLVPLPAGRDILRGGVVSRHRDELHRAAGLPAPEDGPSSEAMAAAVAESLARGAGASHALAVLIDLDDGPDRRDLGGVILIGIAGPDGTVTRGTRILGGWEWIRLGAAELALDCLRRHLLGLPVHEKIDFEKK